MSLLLRNLFLLHRLMDEANPDGGGGGGGAGDITIDIDKTSDQIGADLGFGNDDDKDNDLGSATPPGDKSGTAPTETDAEKAVREAKERAVAASKGAPPAKPDAAAAAKALTDAKTLLATKKVDFTGKTDAEVLELAKAQAPQPKPMVKSWKKELGETWAKLPAEAQDVIIQREAQVEEGFRAQAPAVKYAHAVFGLLQPHEGLLQTQGIKNHVEFLNSMVQAHVVLSSHPDAQRYSYMANVMKNYGLDPAKVAEAFATLGSAAQAAQPTEAERQLAARLAKVESATKLEQEQRFNALKASTDAEIAAFAADPAHPFFDEVSPEVSLFLADPRITLAAAYEMAVYANPVTRAKELTRLREEAGKTAREEADKLAAAAVKAKGTKILGEERHRASPDLLGSMEDTMRATLKTINSRTD